MGVSQGYSSIITNGLVFAYDVADTRNSYLGRPTNNVNTYPLYIYNNVPGSVSSTLTATSETYRGATVYRQDLTALDGSGASWLSGCNNPGIGVYTYPGGGGNANQYSGHSIFFKTTVAMCSCPCYTHYSNIGGWQSSCNIEDMGDGWFRPYVLWYNTSTQSDGKFWAINPASTAVGQTITIYWAGPFREDLNSTSISQYVNGSRSTSQSVIDIASSRVMTVNNDPFTTPAINPQLYFDGSNDYIDVNPSSIPTGNQITVEFVMRNDSSSNSTSIIAGGSGAQDFNIHLPWGDGNVYWDCGSPFNRIYKATSLSERTGIHHWTFTKNATTGEMYIYLDGNLWHSGGGLTSTIPSLASVSIGRYDNGSYRGYYYNGYIYVSKVYSRALSAGEILQNYNHYKTRFNLS